MRVENWQGPFYSEMLNWNGCVFEWGRTDCCQFVRRIALVLTGKDYGEKFQAYDSERDAVRMLVSYGGIQGLLESAFGCPANALRASVGDVMLCEMGMGLTACICIGARCVAPALAGGLDGRPITSAIASWTI